jgi:hypothetical protein
VTERQVKGLIENGELPYVCVSLNKQSLRARKRIAECDLNAFIENRRVEKPQPARRKRRT